MLLLTSLKFHVVPYIAGETEAHHRLEATKQFNFLQMQEKLLLYDESSDIQSLELS
jgi:hypothetical protein